MKYYIAYGSNLNKEQMRFRCPNAKPYASGILEGHELLFKGSKTGAYATVEPRVGSSVPVGVWTIDPRDERRLDLYEGFPTFYYKKNVTVSTDRGLIEGLIYVMHEDHRIGQPTDHYAQVCLEGYNDFGLDKLAFFEAILANILKEDELK